MKGKTGAVVLINLLLGLFLFSPSLAHASPEYKITEEKVSIERPSVKQYTSSLFRGEEKVLAKGADGVALKTTIVGGKSDEVTLTVLDKPLPKIIAIGTKIPTLENLPKKHVPGGSGLTEEALQLRAILFYKFPFLETIGGYRECDTAAEHCTGRALDIMVEGEQGYEVMRYLEELHEEKVIQTCWNIYEQNIHFPNKNFTPEPMKDRGSVSQNHYDHIHAFLADKDGKCSLGR